MKKVLKIVGIVIGGLILALIAAKVFFPGTKSGSVVMSQPGYEAAQSGLSGTAMPGVARNGAMMKDSAVQSAPMTFSESASTHDASAVTDKKVIKNGNMTLKVDSVDQASDKISQVAKQYGGDVFSTNIYQNANKIKTGTVTVRVPVANFENAFSDMKKIATLVVRESVTGQDVTEEYTDLQAQLKNKQAEEEAFAKILQENTGKIDDILAVTSELARVRGEIEQIQGQIKFMDSQTDMASITAMVSEDVTVGTSTSWRPWEIVKSEVNNMLGDLQRLVGAVIVLVVRIIPILIVIAIILWVAYRIAKPFFKKLNASSDKEGRV